MIELTAADGNTLSAYRADPSDTPKGAVVVLQEVFGIDPHIKKVTENFAAQGYVAIAPALFDRVKKNVELGYDEAGLAAGLELKSQVEIGDAIADIQAAVDSVKDTGKVAIVGYCWGGYLAYLSANKVGGLACAIGYYGGGITDVFQEKRKIPTLLHFSEEDPLIPFEEVIQFRAYRPDVSAFSYPGAGHGFNCAERSSYNEEAAKKALERTLFWISQYVEGQPPILLKNAGFYAAAKTEKKKKPAKASADGPPDYSTQISALIKSAGKAVSVIKHEFGKKERQTVRRFRSLLTLDAMHEANVRSNPVPYLERASERIYQLEKALFEAAQAAEPSLEKPPTLDTVRVNAAEYQRLLNCRAIIEKALADLGPSEDV